jgi:hypothetical protein
MFANSSTIVYLWKFEMGFAGAFAGEFLEFKKSDFTGFKNFGFKTF